ncbi:MAG TPA: hypothetical protein VMM12_11025 [Longimicrobiales bacterium]|nr:hypothetical protein [Longimicrobiales bacterium]
MLKILVLAILPHAAVQDGALARQEHGPDARALARAARTAAFHYESLQRRLAPATNDGGRRADQCDERIGRFCFWYDSPSDTPDPPPPPEPPAVADARTVAVRAHRRWFSAQPEHPEAAGFLVRFLVESGRTGEAAAAARTHVWAAKRDPAALLLLGMALHEGGDFAAAEALFDSARAGMDDERRRRLDDVRVLLERRERAAYGDLSPAEREAYNRRFWALSDPSLLEPGNERRTAHYARHAWSAILAEAPRVRGKISWGKDHEEILLRFGIASGRKRIRDFQPHLLSADPRFIESFDPASVALVPAALLTRGLPEAPPPGIRHELVRDTAPSAYAPVRLRLRAMDHVATRIPDGTGAVLRVDAVLAPDTTEPRTPVAPRGILAVLDTSGTEVLRVAATVRAGSASGTALSASARVPPGAWVYRVEMLDDSTRLAGLSQYRVDIDAPRTVAAGVEDFALSDLIVAAPFGDSLPSAYDDPVLEPHPSLVLPTGSRVGLFALARGLRRDGRYSVEWSVEREAEGSILGQAVRWLGRQLGIVEREQPLRIRWDDVAGGGVAPVAVNMDLSRADAGLYRIGLRVIDAATGEARTSQRRVRLSAERPGPPRD